MPSRTAFQVRIRAPNISISVTLKIQNSFRCKFLYSSIIIYTHLWSSIISNSHLSSSIIIHHHLYPIIISIHLYVIIIHNVISKHPPQFGRDFSEPSIPGTIEHPGGWCKFQGLGSQPRLGSRRTRRSQKGEENPWRIGKKNGKSMDFRSHLKVDP